MLDGFNDFGGLECDSLKSGSSNVCFVCALCQAADDPSRSRVLKLKDIKRLLKAYPVRGVEAGETRNEVDIFSILDIRQLKT